ncbi:MAG: hypothetical protein J3T61_08635, partial [Candidatus Brocadiales bacterium]|nr:hypothetical protein [Candidatus Bathyanammoxibius sp.]
MARIVNSSQQITHATLFPASIHSRVINLFLEFSAGLSNDDFVVMPPQGNNIRLLNIKLACFPQTIDAFGAAFIAITTG